MYILPNKELDLLTEKISYVRATTPFIHWVQSDPDCYDEYKTDKALSEKEAKELLEKIYSQENPTNHNLYKIVKSRHIPDAYRIIVLLEDIHHE